MTPEQQAFAERQGYTGGAQPANAIQDYYKYNPYNPQTGQFEGAGTIAPFQIAPFVQQRANLGTWQYQQRLMDQGQAAMRGGVNFMLGANNLLQSFRPGGSAALEAGTYAQTAGLMQNYGQSFFQRAQMTQPLDYMFEYRREEGVQAQRRLNRQLDYQNWISLVSGASQVGASYLGSPSRTEGPGQQQQGVEAGMRPGGGGGSPSGGPGGASAGTGMSGQSVLGSTLAGAPTTLGGPQQGQDGMKQLDPNAQPGQGAATGAEPQYFDGGAGGGTGAGGGGSGTMEAGGGGGYEMAAAGSGQGDFTPKSFAAGAAARTPAMLGLSTAMLYDYVADLYESDAFYGTLSAAIDARWQERMQ